MFMFRMPKNLSQETQEISLFSSKYEVTEKGKFPWKPSLQNTLSPTLLDIDWLIAQPLLPFLVQVAPAHLLYRSIITHGLEDSVEVIEWIRGEQLQKVFDFDIWENSFEYQVDDISVNKFLSWLRIWLEIGQEFCVKRFLELEEESIVLILSKVFEIIPEGLSTVSEEIRENWWKTADNKFYLKIRENADESFELLKLFVDALYQYNARIAESVFAHSAMLVRQESLEFGLRWRATRLADQGFVDKDEALKILTPKKLEILKKSIQEAKELENKRNKTIEKIPLAFEHNMYDADLYENMAHFLSSLDPEEGVQYMQLALGNESLKKITGSQNIDPSYFYEDEDFISEATESLIKECNKILIRSEFNSNHGSAETGLLIERAFHEFINKDSSKALHFKNRIVHLSNTLVSGFMNSIDNDTLVRSITIVRGVLNLGLELCLLTPDEYGLVFNHTEGEIENSITCIQLLGIEYLFHLGWSVIFSLQNELSKKIVDIDLNHSIYKGKLKTIRKVTISDSSSLEISLAKLVENQRYSDIKVWLSSIEQYIPTELFLVFEGLFDRVPMYPDILSKEKVVRTEKMYLNIRPFSSIKEVEKTKTFINNFHHNFLMEK